MDRNVLILILLILMGVVLAFELAYIMLRKKRRKGEMFRKKELVETVAEKAHNLIITTESISRTLANQGINTLEADSLLRQARAQETARDYSAAVERAEAAKLVLLRLKRQHTAENQAAPSRDPDKRPMNQSLYGTTDPSLAGESVYSATTSTEEPASEEEKDLDSLPTNYLQSKFMLDSTRDNLDRKGISHGEAHDHYLQAKEFFDRKEYSKALSHAIKADRLLDTNSVNLIAEEKPSDSEEIENPVCPNCGCEIAEDDTFCRECGQKLGESKCPGCGEPIDSADKFCRKCGYKL